MYNIYLGILVIRSRKSYYSTQVLEDNFAQSFVLVRRKSQLGKSICIYYRNYFYIPFCINTCARRRSILNVHINNYFNYLYILIINYFIETFLNEMKRDKERIFA